MRYAANHGLGQLARYGDFIPTGERPTATQWRCCDDQLYALAMYLYSLEPPPSPNRFDALAAKLIVAH